MNANKPFITSTSDQILLYNIHTVLHESNTPLRILRFAMIRKQLIAQISDLSPPNSVITAIFECQNEASEWFIPFIDTNSNIIIVYNKCKLCNSHVLFWHSKMLPQILRYSEIAWRFRWQSYFHLALQISYCNRNKWLNVFQKTLQREKLKTPEKNQSSEMWILHICQQIAPHI